MTIRRPQAGAQAISDIRTTQNLVELLDGRAISRFQMLVFWLCMAISVFDGYDLAAMALAVPLIASEWGVPHGEFGPALAAALGGLGLGSVVSGSAGDRFGRKPLVLISSLVIALGSLATSFTNDITGVTACRLFTGVGFGIAMPNIYALVSEYYPRKRHIFTATCLACAISAGGLLAGLVAPALADRWGWEAIFLLGALLPGIFFILSLFLLGESPLYLAARSGKDVKLRRILDRMRIDAPFAALPLARNAHIRLSGFQFLKAPYTGRSLFYATAWSTNAFTFYLVANWLPSMLQSAGLPASTSMRGLSSVYAGAIAGGLSLSWLMDRAGRRYALWTSGAFAGGTMAFLLFGISGLEARATLVLIGMVGILVGGCQYVLPGIGVRLFPPEIRATALGWIGGASRIGGVLGPLAGGFAVSAHWQPSAIFALLAFSAALCALTMLALGRLEARAGAHDSRV